MRGDAEPDKIARFEALALKGFERGGRVVAEGLQIDDRAQPQRGACLRRGAGEARVTGCRDPGREALRGAEPGDGEVIDSLQPPLSLDVRGDPGNERESVADARIDRVLEV